MKFGFVLPNNWGVENPHDVVDVAVKAEERGYDTVWVNHHILTAGYVLERLDNQPYHDALTILTYVAAKTERVKLATSVLVLPYLNPLALAKSAATLDVLSGGRVALGLGVGGLKAESDGLAADYSKRGAYTDESIAVMKELWTQENPKFDGEFYQFSGAKFSPKPLQKPYLPIWIGGNSNPALRRVARAGDGWHPMRMPPEQLAERIEYLKRHLDAAGRDISEIHISIRLELEVLGNAVSDNADQMVGTPDQLLRAIEAYSKVGLNEIALAMATNDVGRFDTHMERFAESVMSRI